MTNFVKAALVAAAAFASVSAQAQEEEKNFDGIYLGAELGLLDTDGAGSDFSYNGFVGGRKQFGNGFVLGAEASIGSADITYLDNIWSITGTVGYVVAGGKGLVYTGAGYVEAKASALGVSETDGDYAVKLGYEHALTKVLSVRGQVTSLSFDSYNYGIGIIARF